MSDEQTQGTLEQLRMSLSLAVPLWVQRFIDERWSIDALMRLGPKVASVLGSEGTALMWPAKPDKGGALMPDGTRARAPALGTAGLFNLLAQGLAAASFVPGGIKFAGAHFESNPEWLQSGEAARE